MSTGVWQRGFSVNYLRDRIRSLLQLDDTPHRLALAFAVGVFIAFSPTYGLHLITCFLIAWVLRLSKLVMITATFLNNPWTIVPMYGFCLWFGSKIVGQDIPMPQIAWNELTLSGAYLVIKPYLWPFVVGTLVAGVVAAVISYGAIYWAVVRYRKSEGKPGKAAQA